MFGPETRPAGWEGLPLDPRQVDAQPTTVSDTLDHTSGHLAGAAEDQEKEQQHGPHPEPRANHSAEKSEADLKPDESSPQCGTELPPQLGPEPAPRFAPASEPRQEEASDVQPETDLTVSDLLQHYLAPERIYGDNQYHCARCAGLRDADCQLRLLTPPPHLVVSLVPFVFDRRTGARRKVLAPLGLTERLTVPLAGRQPAQYRIMRICIHCA